jgi:hypothetical protein
MKRTCIVFLTIGAIQLSAQSVDMARERERAEVLLDQLSSAQYQVRLNGVPATVTIGASTIKNHPFSATEENRTSQVLGNGAKIENKTTGKLFRDADGRTRTEDAQGNITIVDPVAGFRATLNPKTKLANKINQPAGGRGGAFGTVVAPAGVLRTARITSTGSELQENLGVQSVNGVPARGERVTVTIPKGDIGNDRELKVITERWVSEDLQMLVKSVNTDPRYGDTTYELTGISLSAPNLSLFQIPSDYTVTEPAGRGGGAKGSVLAPSTVPPGARGGRNGKQQ